MSDKPLPSAGIGSGTALTTILTGILSSIYSLVPPHYQEVYKNSIPWLCPLIAFLILGIYNRLIEPPGLAGVRRKYIKDAKHLKKMRKDKSLSAEQRKVFDDEYIQTQLQIGRLGRDYSDGKLQIAD
ncbi:hypothetical protein [Serratia proteamaculans]